MPSRFPGNDPDSDTFAVVPHDPDLPSYGLFAKYVYERRSVRGGTGASGNPEYSIHEWEFGHGQNCHHGAPGRNNGGWQGLNYPPEIMNKLWEAHLHLGGGELPYFWCGKPNSISESRAGNRISKGKDGWYADRADITPDHLEHLQKCLKKIGEEPIEIDIPNDVEWSSFEEDESFKVIPDRIGRDGQVIYRVTEKINIQPAASGQRR